MPAATLVGDTDASVGTTGTFSFDALQDAVAPPFVPPHVQFHGPVPVTLDGDPTEHNSAVGGALVYCFVPAIPHTPLTNGAGTTALTITLCGDVSVPRFALTAYPYPMPGVSPEMSSYDVVDAPSVRTTLSFNRVST